MIAADSQSIYWYLAQPDRLSPPALVALNAAEDADGIVISAWTVPELWMASTRKRGQRAIPRAAYELVRATLLDPDNAIRVEPFDHRMWPHSPETRFQPCSAMPAPPTWAANSI